MKKKIVIISASYPFGEQEVFLENEIKYLSQYFNIHIIPNIEYNSPNEKPRKLPKGVTYAKPILPRKHIKRFIKGMLNPSPFFFFIPELFNILKHSQSPIKSLLRWYHDMIIFRASYANKDLKKHLQAPDTHAVYYYWGRTLVSKMNIVKKTFIRVHGGEVYDERNFNYVNFKKLKYIANKNITYLPISLSCQKKLLSINQSLQIHLNRLGVYDIGVNPFQTNREKIRIVSCSSLIPLKRVHLIINALKQVKHYHVEWVHFGDGPLFDDLKQQTNKLSKNISVFFMGRQPNAKVLDYYANNSIDLFINVSSTEGVPVSIMEALSFGIPCFATDVGGTSEIVDNTVGYLVPKDFDLKKLLDFLEKIQQENTALQLRENARKRWENQANAEINYQKLVAWLVK